MIPSIASELRWTNEAYAENLEERINDRENHLEFLENLEEGNRTTTDFYFQGFERKINELEEKNKHLSLQVERMQKRFEAATQEITLMKKYIINENKRMDDRLNLIEIVISDLVSGMQKLKIE